MRFDALDSIRGLAALVVVLFHLHYGFPGYLAVDLFFILSGFVLSYRYFNPHNQGDISLTDFTVARLSRLYPLHLFTLMAVLLFYLATDFPDKGDGNLYTFLQHVFLLQNTGMSTWWVSWNQPSWSISVEFWVNLIVFAWLAWRANTLMLLILSIVGYSVLIANIKHLDVHIQLLFSFLNGGMVRCFAGFFLGMVLYRWFIVLKNHPLKASSPTLAFGLFSLAEIALVLAAVSLVFWAPMRTKMDFNAPFVFAALVFCFAWQGGIVSWLFAKLRIAFLGTLSYSLYLNHFWLLNVMKSLGLPTYGFKLEVFVWVFGVLVPVSIATYYLIEKPGQSFIRVKWQSIKTEWDKVKKTPAV